jgi:hypothetical protein
MQKLSAEKFHVRHIAHPGSTPSGVLKTELTDSGNERQMPADGMIAGHCND